jgi:hypothetical protein
MLSAAQYSGYRTDIAGGEVIESVCLNCLSTHVEAVLYELADSNKERASITIYL